MTIDELIFQEQRGRVYFWDHENGRDEDWDRSVETTGNVTLIAGTFTEYVASLKELSASDF
jgi:hypothetical protein